MFKKLKDKIAEEVKQSPLKSVQQLAQAVVSPSSSSVFEPSSSNDKFCIEEGDIEEDEKQEQAKPGGFTSVTLTGQTSSPVRQQGQKHGLRTSTGSLMAEADNFFPKFEPQPTNFHVQSDWESASEVEDRGSQLEHITKESLYEAYRKVYNRYNRMKNKYHEIVTHYRQLERETEKAKNVLTETQDKALLRISELREQCLLEQQAKAHLEEALRNELEERDHIINTLKTKVQYLKGVSDSSVTENVDVDASILAKEEGNLIDFTDNSSVSTVPLPFDASNSEEKINWFEDKLKNLSTLLNEDSTKVQLLKRKLMDVRKQNCDIEDVNTGKLDNIEPPMSEQQKSENNLNKALSDLIAKLSEELQTLQKFAVHCSLLNSENVSPNFKRKLLLDKGKEKLFSGIKSAHDIQSDEVDRYTASIRELEEQNKSLIQKLNEESFSAKKLKNELNSLSTITDILRRKIKLSNDHFGKNDAINCLITDVENELIQEWNLCFQNFLQTRCEVTVLKDTREDLEKELLRLKEEIDKLENTNKEITENNNKLKGEIEVLQKDMKGYITQLESLSKDKSDLNVSNENLQRQIKKLQETLSMNEKVSSERCEDMQKIVDDKKTAENKLASLESELQNTRSEYSHVLEMKQQLDAEVSCLRQENSDIIAEKESLNNKVNEMENKLKQVEDDYNIILDTRDGLDNQINSLTKLTEELTTEKIVILTKISNLEKDLEEKKIENSILLKEKGKLLREMDHIKEEYEIINTEKLSITEKLHNLAGELQNAKESYSKSLESTQQQSDETVSLKKEKDELMKEKCCLESKIEILNEDIQKLKSNSEDLVEARDKLSEELASVKKERDQLLSEIQSMQNKIVELESTSKLANEELSIFKKKHSDLIAERNSFQNEIQRLQECLDTNIEKYSSHSETNSKLSQELTSLKKEREDLIKEKNTLEKQSKKLDNDLLVSREELLKLSKEYKELSEKLQILQQEHEDLSKCKQIDQESLNKIKNDLKQKEEMLVTVNEKTHVFSEKIKTLQNEYDQIEKEYKLLQDRYNSSVTECENNKELVLSLTEAKNKLSEEVNSFKKNSEHSIDLLNKIKGKLEIEQNSSSELKSQLCILSESLKNKCEETNEKCKENLCLQSEIEKLMEKISVSNCYIEKLTKEKNVVLNYLLTNLNNVKIIKELQKNLYDFVKQFQVEISHEINEINIKMGHDLLKHINDLLDPENCSKMFAEVERKSKEDIDSYNSKLKNLQGKSKVSEEMLHARTTSLENYSMESEPNPNIVKFRQMGHLEKLTELDECSHYNPEAYLKQAISLMKSFTNLINHNSVNHEYSNDLFAPDNEKYFKLNEVDSKNLQKEIVAMESFITDCETKCKETLSDTSQQLNTDNVKEHDNSTDMELRQEISLKDDIIKKLQSVIEEYEQKKGVDDTEFLYKQKVNLLEQENKSLLDKIQKLQETHELNVKSIISEYEKKIEEAEEENGLYDFEKGQENKHVVNEMKEQIQNLQQDLEERGDAFEKLYEEHQQSVKNLDGEIHQLRSNHDKELREQDKKWRQCLDRRLAEEETRHQQELTSLNMQWCAERRELETARRLAVNAVESGSGSNELLRRQVQALTMQLTELRNTRCEACDRKRKNDLGQDHRPKSIQDCTEMEYLRNILYEYMMGKEPLVLAKVLCALVKFDENQTKEIVSKEEHRITLFGQLGIL